MDFCQNNLKLELWSMLMNKMVGKVIATTFTYLVKNSTQLDYPLFHYKVRPFTLCFNTKCIVGLG